jgi:hypothetical protein
MKIIFLHFNYTLTLKILMVIHCKDLIKQSYSNIQNMNLQYNYVLFSKKILISSNAFMNVIQNVKLLSLSSLFSSIQAWICYFDLIK